MSNHHGPVRDWLTAYISADPTDDCVIWPFSCMPSGHARAWNSRLKRMDSAYRVVWERVNGEPFTADIARHSCGNGHLGCVNDRHVVGGTHVDNMDDRRRDGRAARGSRHGLAVMTEESVALACRRIAAGSSIRVVAEDLGVSASELGDIWRGEKWTHVACPRRNDSNRKCRECGAELPEDAHTLKAFCNDACRSRESGRKRTERLRSARTEGAA